METQTVTEQLCLTCGLCCNGVLFRDVKLAPTDNRESLRQAGMATRPSGSGRTGEALPQPCAALCSDNRCRIYAHRPGRCRGFECALFLAVAAEKVTAPAALRTIRATRRQAEKVRSLLSRIGEPDEAIPLSLRFRRACRRLERSNPGDTTSADFAELTLEMHTLNLILSTKFYPGGAPST
jgi:Fe-S-cluster containining protein